MGRYTGPKCKLCRREGEKLYLRGFRCESAKCAMNKRAYPPGEHPWKRGKFSEYGRQLREKQKVKRYYGIFERQFRLYFKEAERIKGDTGENLLRLLELRLDNAVYMLGLATSRTHARQMIRHGHITLNGKKALTPSIGLRLGETIAAADKVKTQKLARENCDLSRGRNVPSWLDFDESTLSGKVAEQPSREQVSIPVEEQLIIEFCSK